MKNKITKLTRSKILKDSILSTFIRFSGKGISFILRIVAIRVLGDYIIGIYSLSKDILESIYRLLMLGLDTYFMRYVASTQDRKKIQKTYSYILGILIVIGIISTIFFVAASLLIANYILKKPEMTTPLRIIMLAIVPWILLTFYIKALRGAKLPVVASAFDTMIIPSLNLLILIIFFKLNIINNSTYNIIAVISVWITSIFSLLYFNHKLSLNLKLKITGENKPKDLWSFGGKLYMLNVLNNISEMIYSFLKGRFIGIIEIGILSTNKRILSVLSIPANAVFNSIIADIVESYEKKDIKRLKRLRYKAMLLTYLVMIPLVIFMLLFKNLLLSKLGSIYLTYGYILLWQIATSFINVVQQPFELTLNMAKKQNALILYTIVGKFILRSILAVALINYLGLLGAVITDFIMTFITSITYTILVTKIYKI